MTPALDLLVDLNMAYNSIKEREKTIEKVRNNTTNKSLAKMVARRATILVNRVSSLVNSTSTAPQFVMYVITCTITNLRLTFR